MTNTLRDSPSAHQRWPGIRGLIRLHWRGQLSPLRALALCPSPILLLGALGLMFVMAGPYQDSHWPALILLCLLLLAMAVSLWWMVGLCRGAIRLKSQQQPWSAMGCLVGALGVALPTLGFLTWGVVEGGTNWLDIEAARQAKERCMRRVDLHYGAPWSVEVDEAHQLIKVSGRIGDGSAQALQRAIERHPTIRLLWLESPGGLVVESFGAGEIVKAHGFDTLVTGLCASACTHVFLNGAQRFAAPTARLGFHRSTSCLHQAGEADTLLINEEVAILHRDRGVPKAFTSKVLSVSHVQMWWPSLPDLVRNAVVTDSLPHSPPIAVGW